MSAPPSLTSLWSNAVSFVIEKKAPLHTSTLWNMQTRYYDEKNISAWSEPAPIPSFLSSNAYIAQHYAKAILSGVRDMWNRSITTLDPFQAYHYFREGQNMDEPLYVVEVGAGHGKLSYLICKWLLSMREFWPSTNAIKFAYIFDKHGLTIHCQIYND